MLNFAKRTGLETSTKDYRMDEIELEGNKRGE
jgi:hypothetical protein